MRRRARQQKKSELRRALQELKRLRREQRDSHERWSREGRFLGNGHAFAGHVRFEGDLLCRGVRLHFVNRRMLATYDPSNQPS